MISGIADYILVIMLRLKRVYQDEQEKNKKDMGFSHGRKFNQLIRPLVSDTYINDV
jgi:hypothetical protein